VEGLRQELLEKVKEAERAAEERDNNQAEFVKYKTRSHVMLKKKEEELRRAVAAAPQAEGALKEALSQVEELTHRNDSLQQELNDATAPADVSASAAAAAAAATSAASAASAACSGGGDGSGASGASAVELARLTQALEELRSASAQREKSLTQDMEALLEDSEATEARHEEMMEVFTHVFVGTLAACDMMRAPCPCPCGCKTVALHSDAGAVCGVGANVYDGLLAWVCVRACVRVRACVCVVVWTDEHRSSVLPVAPSRRRWSGSRRRLSSSTSGCSAKWKRPLHTKRAQMPWRASWRVMVAVVAVAGVRGRRRQRMQRRCVRWSRCRGL
jgi:hypothetical protein